MSSGYSSEPLCLVNFDIGNEYKSAFIQLLDRGQQIALPASQLCLGLTADASHSLLCTILENNGGIIDSHSTAFVYGFEASESPKLHGIVKHCKSCVFHRAGLWCVSQPGRDLEAGVISLSFADLLGLSQVELRENPAVFGTLSDPISMEAMDGNVACVFTAHGASLCDLRAKGIQCIYQSRNRLLSGVMCKEGDALVVSSDADTVSVIETRKATNALYETSVSFPVTLRSSIGGKVALAISRRQVGVLHVGRPGFLGAFENPGTILDATLLTEEQHIVRVLSSSADGCLSDWSMEF
ncbi:hypothetical protein DQ04_01331040 [Trypanosoma grayi]|uniref:hypothetical protein n=1 Tax=Trypanosoma grayi TaxID=71804 RepID=UPI0004F42895|nr:hypothetical protein DQ04_01331040 [Trypanosoma grayi]KEG12917.1 hypothetical protein DQ04_01331040 [Trypanosoma grayi]